MRYLLALLFVTQAHALTVDQTTEMSSGWATHGPSNPSIIWRADQFDPSLGTLNSVTFHATIVNTFNTVEYNATGRPLVHTPLMGWTTVVSLISNGSEMHVGSDSLMCTSLTRTLAPGQGAGLAGVETHEINATLTRNLGALVGEGFAFLVLSESVFFDERYGGSSTHLTFDLSLTYDYEPANPEIALAGASVPDGGATWPLLASCLAIAAVVRKPRTHRAS